MRRAQIRSEGPIGIEVLDDRLAFPLDGGDHDSLPAPAVGSNEIGGMQGGVTLPVIGSPGFRERRPNVPGDFFVGERAVGCEIESSARAFEWSCWRLLKKLLAWVEVHTSTDHDKRRLERWKLKNDKLIGYATEHQQELWPSDESGTEDEDEDFITQDDLAAIERLNPDLYKVDEILDDTFMDLDQIVTFLEYGAKVDPAKDDKLKALVKMLKSDKDLKNRKVIIFPPASSFPSRTPRPPRAASPFPNRRRPRRC